MNLNELGEKCQKEIDNETLLNQCIEKGNASCPEIDGVVGYCDDCPVEKQCPSTKKDWTE
jgi:hypothetical protein